MPQERKRTDPQRIYSSGTIAIVSIYPSRDKVGYVKRTLNLASLDIIRDIFRAPAINLAANRVASSQNFLDSPLQLTGKRLEPHGAGDVDDLIERD